MKTTNPKDERLTAKERKVLLKYLGTLRKMYLTTLIYIAQHEKKSRRTRSPQDRTSTPSRRRGSQTSARGNSRK
jgi:hypothetical protein